VHVLKRLKELVGIVAANLLRESSSHRNKIK